MLNWVQVDHSELLRHLTTPDGESESEGPAQMEICPPPPPPVPGAPASFLTALETSSPSSPLLTAFLGWSQTTCFLPPRCWHTPALTWGVSPGGGPDEGESWWGGPDPRGHVAQFPTHTFPKWAWPHRRPHPPPQERKGATKGNGKLDSRPRSQQVDVGLSPVPLSLQKPHECLWLSD